MDDYLRQYGLLLFLGGAAVVVPTSVLMMSFMAGKLGIRPSKPNPLKLDPYECGMESIGEPRWERFNVRYYRYALLFVLFDVEVVFLFPWATRLNALGWAAFGAVGFFLLLMVAGWAYEWRRGGMDWDESGAQHQFAALPDPDEREAVAA